MKLAFLLTFKIQLCDECDYLKKTDSFFFFFNESAIYVDCRSHKAI